MPDADVRRISSRPEFAQALTALRERAGLTVRDVAKAVGIPDSTAGDYFAGAHLPPVSQPHILVAILAVCGVTDAGMVSQWQETLTTIRRVPGRRPVGAPIPYRGLESFQTAHADWFYGRERLIQLLIESLRARLAEEKGPLVVVGPSGSGKSSVLRAGVIPALRRGELDVSGSGEWPVLLITPGARPLQTLAEQLAIHVVKDSDDEIEAELRAIPEHYLRSCGQPGRLVLVVDQFEEIFTACDDAEERLAFVDVLCAAAGENRVREPPALVVLGVRADFYSHLLLFQRLARAVQKGQVVIGPMTEAELRDVIVKPANKAGLDIEDGLVELLLRDLEPVNADDVGAAHDAGALPLLSHALLTTWRRSRGRRLTALDYRDCGGISGAVAETAEVAYADLTEDQQHLARRIFLRLVHVAEDTADTRRRVTGSRLLSDVGPASPEEIQIVLDRFVEQRLITVDLDIVEISHEALIRAWPRLRSWIDVDRGGLIIAHRFTDTAAAWQREGFDHGLLYRGARLAAVREWVETGHQDAMTPLARDFLEASIAQEEEALRLARRRTRRLRAMVAGLATLVSLTLGATALALHSQQALKEQRNVAISRQIASDADRLRAGDPALAAQLALIAYRLAPTAEARSSLLSLYAGQSVTRLLNPSGVPQHVAFALEGRLMATGGAELGDPTLRLWRVTGDGKPIPLGQSRIGPVRALVLSPDGRTLATSGMDETLRLWNIADGTEMSPLSQITVGPGGRVLTLAHNGGILAVGGAGGTVTIYDVADPRQPTRVGTPLAGHRGDVQTIAFSPDGSLLAAGSADHTVWLWNTADPRKPTQAGPPIEDPSSVLHLAFSPDGETLAVAASGEQKSVRLWNVTNPARPVLLGEPITGPAGLINFVAFSPDGRSLAAGSSDNKAWVWDLATRRTIATLPHPAPVTRVRFAGGGGTLISGTEDGVTRLWRLPGPLIADPLLTDPLDIVFTADISSDSRRLLAGSYGAAPLVRLWNVSDPRHPTPISPPMRAPTGPGLSGAAAQSPDGRLVAAGTVTGPLYLWDVRDPTLPRLLKTPLIGATKNIESVAFSPDSKTLAAASDDTALRLWDVSDPDHPVALATLGEPEAPVYATAFSADGRLLAAGSGEKKTWLWEITDPRHPKKLAELSGHRQAVYSVALSPDSRILAAGSADKTIRLWDISQQPKPLPLGDPLKGPNNTIYWLDFSPDGRILAAGGGDGTVWLWDVRDPGKPITYANLAGHGNAVWTVSFSPDGAFLSSGGADATVRLWMTNPERVAKQICAQAGDVITKAEWGRYLADLPYDPPC
ncbi:hypothetical protein Aple_078720 [Acrocarpospora pleiomorpha]|uniref:HTH cro/C1-type domain-containing protein n=1 Tax=Acrocarpospora pleiomorpha TaxID=90975 RepID=A0A5M3XZR4_9ACTN|nr:helix-turn-helix domain-containing protein [Acrocarpospora pleiomorpha]GES24973.1 hypothetical protein Aple_078720 [Acrocarpospora pleiomorpha]